MQTVLFIEPLPLIRHSICSILSEGHPDYQVLEMDMPDTTPDGPYPENIDLVIVSVGATHHRSVIIDWIQKHYQKLPILVIVDAHEPPPPNTLPATVTCVSHEITPKVLKALVNLLLAGCTDQQLHPWLYRPTKTDTQQPKQEVNTIKDPVDEWELLGLTPRQYEVLVLLSKGYPIKTVGRVMNISAATAKAHTEALYQRLDVNSRNAAVYKAIQRGATLGWGMDKVRSMANSSPERREAPHGPWGVALPPGYRPSRDNQGPGAEQTQHSDTPRAA